MTPEQKLELHKANVESAWFHFYTKYRSQLADCTANDNLLNEELESRLLPITFENLEIVWNSLSAEQKAQYAKPTGAVKPHKKEEVATVVTAAEVLDKHGALPAEFTRHKILVEMNAVEYRALKKKYGNEAVENRVNGTE
jgi:hypothetical protein